jgi:hypothetical protein
MNVEVHNSGFTTLGLIARWNELTPEVQLKLIRLINHLASERATKLTWECSNDGELGQTVNLVALPE